MHMSNSYANYSPWANTIFVEGFSLEFCIVEEIFSELFSSIIRISELNGFNNLNFLFSWRWKINNSRPNCMSLNLQMMGK